MVFIVNEFMAEYITYCMKWFIVNNSLDLLIFTAHSDSESEASYASVPRRESTDSGNSANNQ